MRLLCISTPVQQTDLSLLSSEQTHHLHLNSQHADWILPCTGFCHFREKIGSNFARASFVSLLEHLRTECVGI